MTTDDDEIGAVHVSRTSHQLVPHSSDCGSLYAYKLADEQLRRNADDSRDPDRRLASILRDVVRLLPADDREARIAYCRSTGEHGVRVERVGDVLRLTWGGRTLAQIPAEALNDPDLVVLNATYVPAAPDAPGDLDGL